MQGEHNLVVCSPPHILYLGELAVRFAMQGFTRVMAKQKFNPGDLVQLKAGGPKMVVERVFGGSDSFSYRCTWFSGAKHNREDFQEEALQAFKDED